MLTYAPYETDELIENDEYFEYDESDESDEAKRRRGARGPVRTAKRGGNVPPRPTPGFATRAELTATANRLDAKIATNSGAIKAVEGRVNTLSTEQTKLRTDVNKLQGSINDVRNMAMLMPLLTSQTTRTVTTAVGGTINAGDKVVVDTGDSFSKVLPLLMFSGGFGGSSSGGSGGNSGGGMFGGDSGGIMMVALMMAMQDKK
ncbi:hypothetical protein HLB44_01875 [Aquincola sp. S2]|uniref:Uncharacterized protein n=1 Tax=Pseudaquabacterium terrae TaxID=2732868 RepID=A0ABX2ECW0_9BURK|nr:hypothetical protein [Aquabacterium terrae]NRF65725.1 hypothetical protein [Aquabacterium terrae]